MDTLHKDNPNNRRFFDHLKTMLLGNNEDEKFDTLAINKAMFETTSNIINIIPLPTRGRMGFVCSHHDKLVFFGSFSLNGLRPSKMTSLPKVEFLAQVLSILHDTVALLGQRNVTNTVFKRNELRDCIPQCPGIVDCTVIGIIGPALPLKERRAFFPGKHKK